MLSSFVRPAMLAGAVILLPSVGFGQAASTPAKPAAPPQATTDQAFRPAAVRFDAKGLALLDAVRLALQNDPNIQLRDTEVERQGGVLREQAGAFDFLLKGTGDFQYTRSELRDSQKRAEQQKRDQLDQGIATGTRMMASINPAIDNLRNPALVANPASVDLTRGVADPDIRNEVSIIQSELLLINDLLARTTDAAVRKDLQDLRDKTITSGIQRFTAIRDQGNADLARAKELRTNLGDTPVDQWNKSSRVRLDFEKPTRSGVLLNPFVSFDYSSANYVGKSRTDQEHGGAGILPLYRGEVGFEVTLPLLRGRGRADAAASEMAASRDLEVTRLTLLHEKSRSVLETTLAYWEARAAAEQVEVAKQAVGIERQLADLVVRLVAAKEKARADETRVTASLADAQARLENANRQLVEARINLARVMGVALVDAQSIPLAADAFPLPTAFSVDEAAMADLARQALTTRADVLATRQSQEAGKILARGAQLETRRRLDLTAAGWGNSTSEDSPDFGRWVFRSGRVGLDFEVPFGNNTARGRYEQAVASLHQADIGAADAARTVTLNVYRAARSLQLAAERVRWAQEAATGYDKTILDEQQRLRLGDSSLVDVILTEQQTTAARSALVQAQQDYASLLARLRYEAGLLVTTTGGQSNVAFDNLMTVPQALQKR